MNKYIDAEKLIERLEEMKRAEYENCGGVNSKTGALQEVQELIASLQQEQDRMRYCIEYVNPQHPLLDNGELNIRHLRVPDEHGAEMALTLMLSFGAKIYALYRGNVKEGKLDEWQAPMIVDADDWYSTDWLHDILDCGCTL